MSTRTLMNALKAPVKGAGGVAKPVDKPVDDDFQAMLDAEDVTVTSVKEMGFNFNLVFGSFPDQVADVTALKERGGQKLRWLRHYRAMLRSEDTIGDAIVGAWMAATRVLVGGEPMLEEVPSDPVNARRALSIIDRALDKLLLEVQAKYLADGLSQQSLIGKYLSRTVDQSGVSLYLRLCRIGDVLPFQSAVGKFLKAFHDNMSAQLRADDRSFASEYSVGAVDNYSYYMVEINKAVKEDIADLETLFEDKQEINRLYRKYK